MLLANSLRRWLTRKIGLLPGQQQMGDISNMFRAILTGDPPGLRCWAALIPKQHSGDTTLAATGLLCGVTKEWTANIHKDQTQSMFVHCAKSLPVTPLPLLEGELHTLIWHAVPSNLDIHTIFFLLKEENSGNVIHSSWIPISVHAYIDSNK